MKKVEVMTATYHLMLEELKPELLEHLKQVFPGGRVTITVDSEPQDETEFLLHDPKNREILLKSLAQAEQGNLISVDIDELLKKQ